MAERKMGKGAKMIRLMQGKENQKENVLTFSVVAGKFSNAKKMAFLLLGLSFLFSCGKNPHPNQHHDQSVLPGDAIIGNVDWIDLGSVNKKHLIYQQSRAVGLISIPAKKSRCTAFLVSPDTIMTNWHCFPTGNDAVGARLYLDYLEGIGKESFLETVSYKCDEWVMAEEKLDVALLRCEDSPGLKHGIVTLESKFQTRYIGDTIYVIHQNCDYYVDSQCAPTKKVSIGKLTDSGEVTGPSKSQDYFYSADTLGGSSGGPVFSASTYKVMAIHHNGHGQTYWSGGRGTRNSGVPMYKIVQFLNTYYPDMDINTDRSE